ncbi:MAG: LLM class flavin-dependent oxidoreductase [Thermomicrobia bacterium]|nr:LLM class flavin-dependent oxidoreductase [Thermomicrobia bacterium]
MPSLRAGLVVRKPTPAATVAAIEQAEARGVAAVWSTVGGATPDAVTLFAAAGARTTRIGLGTAIVPTYPRHPVALASQALAIEGLAPGRFRLGIGPSHRPTMEGSLGLAMGKPLDHLREYLTILRGLLWEGKTDFDGTYFHVHTALPPDVAPPRTPVPISALRVNAFSLAGEIADGAISWVCPVPYLIDTALPAMRAAAEAAGRRTPPLIGHVPVAVSTDRSAVRESARRQLATYGRLPFYRGMFADAGFPIGGDGILPDALLDELVVSGDADTVTARLAAIQAAGVNELLILPVPIRDADAEEKELTAILGG